MSNKKYSVVISFYNEARNIVSLHKNIKQIFKTLNFPVEYWFVDDGSDDTTYDVLVELNTREPNVNIIKLSRNFGHHTALFAGVKHCKGDYCIIMDGDFQDKPEEIPKLINKINEGYDIIFTKRTRRNEPLSRRIAAKFFWWIVDKLSDRKVHRGQAILRIFSRKVRDEIIRFTEPHKFIAGIFAWVGFRQTFIEIEQGTRKKGYSKYDIRKLLSQTITALTSFSILPLRMITYLGAFLSFCSLLAGLFMVFPRVINTTYSGLNSIIITLFFIAGLQLLCLGIVSEYLGRLFQNSLNRPEYVISELLLSDSENDD